MDQEKAILFGRINKESLESILKAHDNKYEICAPSSFNANLQQILKEWDIADENIHIEGFGPSQEAFDSSLIGQNGYPFVINKINIANIYELVYSALIRETNQ